MMRTRHTVHPKPIVDGLLEQEPLTNKILLLSVKFTDISGRVISLQQFREVPAGIWQQHDCTKQPWFKSRYVFYLY
jgi:hypothetical protein